MCTALAGLLLVQQLAVMGPVFAAEASGLPGDINGDGTVDAGDLSLLSEHVARIAEITDDVMLENADVNGDGVLSAADMTALSVLLETPSDPFCITNVSVDRNSGEAGSIFSWSVETEGGTGALAYAFTLLNCGEQGDTVVAEQDFGSSGSFRASIMDAGEYALTVTCRDEDGRVCSAEKQAPVTVMVPALEADGIRLENAGTVYVGEQLEWSVRVVGGIMPYQYRYLLLLDGEQIDAADSSEDSYTWTVEQPGVYQLQVTCADSSGMEVSADSETVTAESLAQMAEAPAIRLVSSGYTLAQTQDDAQYIPPEALRLCWEPVENVQFYEIILEYWSSGAWVELACGHPSETSFAIAAEQLAGFVDKTLFRIRATAQGSISSEEHVSYFYTASGEAAGSVLVDEETSVKWSISNGEETARSFAVSADVPWTVTADVDWISFDVEGDVFLARISQNTGGTRTGVITVSDGTTSAYVYVSQGIGNGAPELLYPLYSQDPAAPTGIPAGGMILSLDAKDANYVGIKLYEKSASGQLTEVYQTVTPNSCVQVLTSYSFKTNTEYVLELAGYCGEQPESDAVKNYYYILMTDQEQKLLIDGSPAVRWEDFTGFSIDLYSSGAWTYTTDADWLYPEPYEKVSYKKDSQTVEVILEANETQSARTGTITFHCGKASATLTVVQPSWLPRMELPENMSQDPDNPTILPSKGFVERAVYQTGTYACYENGAWGEETEWGQSDTVREWSTLYPDDYFTAGVLYRFTMHSGTHTAVYYAMFSDTVAEPYAVTRLSATDYTDLSLSFTAGADEETVKLSTSGAWSITSDAAWLSVSETKGTSAAAKESVTISAGENLTGQTRTGTLTVWSENTACAKVNVTQAAQDHMILYVRDADKLFRLYDPNTAFKNLDGSKNTVHFKVQSSLTHTVESEDDWITCKTGYLTLAANTTGARRSGTVVISCGTARETITVTQEARLDLPTLASPLVSTDYSSPSVYENGDLKLVLNAVKGAARYHISVLPADTTLLLPNSRFYSFATEIEATGASTYSCVIPANVLSVNAEDYDEICIVAYDAYGYSVYDSFYLKTTRGSAALINGSVTPVWDNATDIVVSKAFLVRSTGSWSARSGASWISLDKTSGVDNETLTLTLQPNSGAARSGQVYVTVDGAETVLTVNQCAWLPEYPSITAPKFSEDPAVPSIVGAGTTSVQVTWDYEPQAEYYKVSLLSFKSNSVQHVEARSPKLYTGEYTFENLCLEPGQRYCIKIARESHWGYTSNSYYFTLDDADAFVLADAAESLELELEGSEDFDAVTVTSSGVWSAGVSDSWILVDNERIKQEDLDADGCLPEDFSHYSGLSGQDLYISVLSNPTDTVRRGTVTVRCGSAESVISVVQEPYYRSAEIYAPQLTNTRKESTPLPYGDVRLRWQGAVGGTGSFAISLYERDEELEYRYYEIFEKKNIASTSYTLPESLLTQGQYYKLWLGTEINGMEDAPGRWYYFRMGYENELVANVSANWSSVGQQGYVEVNAAASGGAGDYRFSYELLRNGQQVSITELDAWTYYTFNITETGTYQVRVYVRDGADAGANTLSGSYTVGKGDLLQLKLSQTQWQSPASGGSVSVTVDTSGSWSITSWPDWITCSASGGDPGGAVTLTAAANASGAREGSVVFEGSGKTAVLTVGQDGAALAEPAILQPGAEAFVGLQDLTVTWSAVSGAGYYIFRLRDITNDTLLMYDVGLETADAVIPGAYLVNGHRYRIAVGAAHSGDSPYSGSVCWSEREFTVAAASEEMASASGCVLDGQGVPLEGALIRVDVVDSSGTQIPVAETETDALGSWSVSGLRRNGMFVITADLAGYRFTSDTLTVVLYESLRTGLDFQADNCLQQEAVAPNVLELDWTGEADGLQIDLETGWTAKADADWLHLSAASGTGPAVLEVAADENGGEEPRTGTVTVTDQNGKTYTVDVHQEQAYTAIYLVYSAETTKTETSIFDLKACEYNGKPLVPKQLYVFDTGDPNATLVINEPMVIPSGAHVKVNGNVEIKAKVTFEVDAYTVEWDRYKNPIYTYINTQLECSGDLTVASKGVIDMHSGGRLRVGGDFTFKPKEAHDNELTKGRIYVGGDLEIKKNFFASGEHEMHLFSTGGQHKINMWNKWFKDQYFNKLILDDEGVDSLYIKEVFTCSSLAVANWDFLQGALNNGNPFVIEPTGTSYSSFHYLSADQQRQILYNVNVGLMRTLVDYGTVVEFQDLPMFCECVHTDTYAYVSSSGAVGSYVLDVNYIGSDQKYGASFGSVGYTEKINGTYRTYNFVVGADPANIAKGVEDFKKVILKYATDEMDEVMKEYLSLYTALMKELVAETLNITVDQLEKVIDDVEKIKELLESLKKEKDKLQEYREIMAMINAAY